ncbi:MAG: magnesium and cobalt transport protein CorA [Halothiobacillaceae bacterium]|nr:magnesium and cobalt transport protein CorA [Halothiobacillaceae bacterium]
MHLMGDALGSFDDAIVNCVAWSADGRRTECSAAQIPDMLAQPGGFLWLELRQPSPLVLEQVQSLFHVHELAIEDVHLAEQHPKFEVYEPVLGEAERESFFMVLTPVVTHGTGHDFALGELHVFLDARVILLLHLGRYARDFDALGRFEHAPARLGRGMVNALHAVLDEVVDNYTPWHGAFEERLDALERQVISNNVREQGVLTDLYALKRLILRLRHAVIPVEEMTLSLVAGAHRQSVPKLMRPYFRDVHDHIVQLLTGLDFLRESHMGVLNLHIALGANRQGVVVRKLAGWGAILAVPTMVFSMYGMNFQNMPELDWKFGYPMVMLITLAGSTLLHRWLRRSGWL